MYENYEFVAIGLSFSLNNTKGAGKFGERYNNESEFVMMYDIRIDRRMWLIFLDESFEIFLIFLMIATVYLADLVGGSEQVTKLSTY